VAESKGQVTEDLRLMVANATRHNRIYVLLWPGARNEREPDEGSAEPTRRWRPRTNDDGDGYSTPR